MPSRKTLTTKDLIHAAAAAVAIEVACVNIALLEVGWKE
jgi:hypothetical protein